MQLKGIVEGIMDSQEQLSQAITELEAGNESAARSILTRLVQQDPNIPDAWVALSFCLDDPEKKEYCLNRALKLDPKNTLAREELDNLTGVTGTAAGGVGAAVVAGGIDIAPEPPAEPPVQEPGIDVSPQTLEPSPAFTPDSMEEFMATQGEWEAEYDQVPVEEPPPQPTTALDPWEIPYAEHDPTISDVTESAQAPGIGTEAETGIAAAWELEAGDRDVDVAAIEKRAKRETAPPRSVGNKMSWYEVWLLAIFSPTESTYRKIIEDPSAKPGRGYLWVFISSFISIIITAIFFGMRAGTLLPELYAQAPELAAMNPQQFLGYGLIVMLVASPILAGLAILLVMLQAGIYQLIAKIFIGEGTFSEMVYMLMRHRRADIHTECNF